jgi:aldose 1-epimerase
MTKKLKTLCFRSLFKKATAASARRRLLQGGIAGILLVFLGAPVLASEPARDALSAPASRSQDMSNLPSASQRHYGYLADGTEVTEVTLRNSSGIELDVIGYGGIITRLLAPDVNGRLGDIVLGLDSLDEYVASNPYFGALIGRYGNRIGKGTFTLDGATFQLDVNDGENHLHGGSEGFDKRVWQMRPFVTEQSAGVHLRLTSPDGDQGYPGKLRALVTYELTNQDELDITFRAVTDKPTIVNMTQHSYFNLAGEGDILGHRLLIPADRFTPVDEGLIPTGALQTVADGPFDFRQAKEIGRDIGADDVQLERGLGYDHNFVLKDQADDELVLAARVTEPNSGRVLEVLTVEPGVQFYSGNFLTAAWTARAGCTRIAAGSAWSRSISRTRPTSPTFRP